MTARAAYLAPPGEHGSGTDARKGHTYALAAGVPAPAYRWVMIGKNSLGTVVVWPSSGSTADTSALQYTGGNTPITDISVLARWIA